MTDAYCENAAPQEAKSKTAGSMKFFRWFIIFASLALAAELVWFLGITPFRPFTRIEISGSSYYDEESLLEFAGITSESSYVFTNANEIQTRIASLPLIESVKVFKRYPGRLDIFVQNRRAAAMAFADAGGVTVPVVFDRQGVIFQIGTDYLQDVMPELPVLSGLVIDKPDIGMYLPARFYSLLENLESIRMSAPELLSAVSEIRIDRRSSEGFDLTLFLIHQKIKIRLSGLNEDLLRYSLLVADVLALRQPEIDMIDFRGAVASYYPKGGYL